MYSVTNSSFSVLAANSQYSSDEDDEEDVDYQPAVDEDWKKVIH